MAHNASLQAGPVPSHDLALERSHERQHDNPTYSLGNSDKSKTNPVPERQDGHLRHDHGSNDSDIEKTAAQPDKIDIAYGEQSTRARGEYETDDPKAHRFAHFYARHKIFFHAFFAFVATGWWAASLALHSGDKNWLIPFLFWLAIMLRLISCWVPFSFVLKPIKAAWKMTGSRIAGMIPEKLRLPLAALLVVTVILIGTFASEETPQSPRSSRATSLFGMLVIIATFYATSKRRSKIMWQTVIVGFLMQFVIALFVLRTGVGYDIFKFISDRAVDLLSSANAGSAFLFNQSIVDKYKVFVLTVIPPIIFFIAIVQVLYYWGFIQWFLGKFAVFFFWSLRVSGAEALVASATPFIGQGESTMLIKPFVAHLTKAEIHQIMTSGFATIAGSVLVAYVGLGVNPQVLISSCVMSIPASLAMSKLRYPEEEETLTGGRVVVPEDDTHEAANVLHAFANGAWLGIKIGGIVIATQLCIIALVQLINLFLTWWGSYLNLTGDYDLTLQLILGYAFYPIAWLLGVDRYGKDGGSDLLRVGRLLATKVIQNEFVAFLALTKDPIYLNLTDRSRIIATYALCGFGNLGSLGTQIGVLSQISPGRGGDVSRVALSALITGIVSTLTSASIAGLVIVNETQIPTSVPV